MRKKRKCRLKFNTMNEPQACEFMSYIDESVSCGSSNNDHTAKKTTLLSIFSTSFLSRKKTLKIFFSVHLKGINSSDADSKSFCHFSMKSKVCCMLLASLVNSTLDSMFLDVSVYLPADEVHWEENWEWNKVRNEKENCILLNFSWKIFLRISIYFMLDLDRSALWNIFELLLGFL